MKLSIKNGAIEINGNTILEEINFEVNDKDHIAIVGENGAGKTTMLKALMNTDCITEGIGEEKLKITNMGKPTIGYLKQNENFDANATLIEEIRKSFTELINMEEKLKKLEDVLNSNSEEKDVYNYTELLERFKNLGGYTYKKEYEVLIKKFGFNDSDKDRLISSFSGGEKNKISFMKLLLSKPDILLLDEPTNHLDIETIKWLEGYLKNYKKSIVIVSHDRMFINNICDVIYDIDYGKTSKYVGNYEYYEKEKERRYESLLKDYEYQQKEIKRLRNIYERFRYKPTKASLAMSRLNQLEKMDILEKPNKIDKKTFKANLDSIEKSGRNVLSLDNTSIGYDKPFGNINLNIERENRIGIIGPNGSGKSTLLKTICKIIKPISGEITYGHKVHIGYFDQNLLNIDGNKTILEEFLSKFKEIRNRRCKKGIRCIFI